MISPVATVPVALPSKSDHGGGCRPSQPPAVPPPPAPLGPIGVTLFSSFGCMLLGYLAVRTGLLEAGSTQGYCITLRASSCFPPWSSSASLTLTSTPSTAECCSSFYCPRLRSPHSWSLTASSLPSSTAQGRAGPRRGMGNGRVALVRRDDGRASRTRPLPTVRRICIPQPICPARSRQSRPAGAHGERQGRRGARAAFVPWPRIRSSS